MTSKQPDNDDDDITFVWTEEQASISKAFHKGLINIRVVEQDGVTMYTPSMLCFISNGETTISVDYGTAKFVE